MMTGRRLTGRHAAFNSCFDVRRAKSLRVVGMTPDFGNRSGTLTSGQINDACFRGRNFQQLCESFYCMFSGDGSGLTNVAQTFVNILPSGVTNEKVPDVTVPDGIWGNVMQP